MKTTKHHLIERWKAGDIQEVCEGLKRTTKINAMDFISLVALTEGGEAVGQILSHYFQRTEVQ